MLSFFRRILASRLGVFISLGFLAIIAFAFAAGDITNLGGMGGIGGSGGVAARAGGETLTVTELQSRAQRAFEQQRSQNPALQIGEFIAQGGVEQVFDQMVAGVTVSAYADDQGMAVSKRMVDGEIAAIPAFQDASGKFSESLFRQLLAREGIQEASLRADIARDLIGKQLIGPAGLGVRPGNDAVLPYASLLLEARSGRIAAIPASAFAPKTPPTDAEIAAFYNQNKASYAARETRSFDRLVMPTEAAAKAIVAEVNSGKSMAQAAQSAGLAVATLKDQSREALGREGNAALAQAAFAGSENAVIGPVRTALGWQVLRVTAINRVPERTIAQVRPEIVTALQARKTEQLLGEFTGKIEDQVGEGATFDEVAKDNGLAIETSRLVISTGQDVQDTIFKPGPDLQPLLKPGFDMTADDDAQLVPIAPGKRYALLDVTDIVAPAPPPLAKVRDIIAQQYLLSLGAARTRQVAENIRMQVAKGTPLDVALKSSGVPLPAPQTVAGRRADLLRGQQRPAPEIALMFAMTPKSVKTLDLPGDQGTLVVLLDQVQRGDAAKQPALVEQVRAQFAQVVGGEYADQFERAMEKRLSVKRDTTAIEKVKQALRAANGVTP